MFTAQDQSGEPTAHTYPANGTAFAIARRGYDCAQVDERLRMLAVELAETGRARDIERARANALENRLQQYWAGQERPQAQVSGAQLVQESPPSAASTTHEGFGVRAEKVLHLAEQLATDLRQQARQEADEVMEKSRAEAETHRQLVEHDLNNRRAAQEQDAAYQRAELHRREQAITAEMNAVKQEAEEIRAQARREADKQERQAQEIADQLRAAAEHDIDEQRTQAHQELSRLHGLHTNVRNELARLHGALADELNNEDQRFPDYAPLPLALEPAAFTAPQMNYGLDAADGRTAESAQDDQVHR